MEAPDPEAPASLVDPHVAASHPVPPRTVSDEGAVHIESKLSTLSSASSLQEPRAKPEGELTVVVNCVPDHGLTEI